MSADLGIAMLVCGLCIGTAAANENQLDPAPDIEFLEYLGMWEQTDEEWLLHDDQDAAVVEERSEPVPEGEVSTEIEDEG
jgi:hypothetical protein